MFFSDLHSIIVSIIEISRWYLSALDRLLITPLPHGLEDKFPDLKSKREMRQFRIRIVILP
jgi:hypothetical protein